MKFFLLGLIALAVLMLIAVRLFRGHTNKLISESSANAQGGTKENDDIAGLAIELEIEGKNALFVLLASDGSINRLGRGTLEEGESHLYIGRTDLAIFERVRSYITPEMRSHFGHALERQDIRGARCKLTLSWQFRGGSSNGMVMSYGSESEGVPDYVAQYVKAAVRETDPWYENFKRTAVQK